MDSVWIWIAGVLGFGLCFLYDINSFRWRSRILSPGFGIGCLLIAAATCMAVAEAALAGRIGGVADWTLLSLAVLSLAGLIYALFFALPFTDTYTKQTDGRPVCDRGAYALCRHPAAIPFVLLYLFLGFALLPGKFWIAAAVFSLLELLYIWYQDRITFPKTFCDYPEYRKKVPFLIPTRASVRNAIKTGKKMTGKKEMP